MGECLVSTITRLVASVFLRLTFFRLLLLLLNSERFNAISVDCGDPYTARFELLHLGLKFFLLFLLGFSSSWGIVDTNDASVSDSLEFAAEEPRKRPWPPLPEPWYPYGDSEDSDTLADT